MNEVALARQLRHAANQARLARGYASLLDDGSLEQAALQHAQRMRNLAFFDHQDPRDGSELSERLDAVRARHFSWAGENLALCPPDAELTVGLWLDSPGAPIEPPVPRGAPRRAGGRVR